MGLRYPLEYELTPKNLTAGTRWLTLRLKNVGADALTSLDVRLNTLDPYSINVYGSGSYIPVLNAGEQRTLAFQVSAVTTTSLYVSIDGWKDGESFHWETPYVLLTVGEEAAELTSLFAMTEPYPAMNETIRCEATIRGLSDSEELSLEFWANTPSGDFEELATIQTKALSVGEEARYSTEVTVEESGMYTIYAYLYDGMKRIGRRTEYLYVS